MVKCHMFVSNFIIVNNGWTRRTAPLIQHSYVINNEIMFDNFGVQEKFFLKTFETRGVLRFVCTKPPDSCRCTENKVL